MRKLAIVALLFGASFAVGQDRLGKSCEEILAMDAAAWTAFFCDTKKDNSELAEDTAAAIYAGCMKEVNVSTAASLEAADQVRLAKYRKLAPAYRVALMTTAQMFAGGGTLFSHSAARGVVQDEELMAKLIAINSKPVEPYTIDKRILITDLIGKVRKQMAEGFRLTDAKKKQMRSFGVDWHKPALELKKAYTNYDALLDLMPRERQDECIVALEWYLERVRRTVGLLKQP